VVVSVAREECRIEGSNGLQHHYVVADGSVKGSAPVFPAVTKDRIFLSNAQDFLSSACPLIFWLASDRQSQRLRPSTGPSKD
jgi:hypothetical protein